MTAIEICRTAALGGHVERCEDCAHTRIAYNSCRNRHCPKCPARQAAPKRRKISATSNSERDMQSSVELRHLHYQRFERTLNLSDGVDRHPRVARGGIDVAMAKQDLDHPHVHTLLE
jgi:Transposase zinc-binding domain